MGEQRSGGLASAVGWVGFPIVPAVLARACHETINPGGADPRDWDIGAWVFCLGPLVGLGFLAGATTILPDRPGRRGFRAITSSRSAWVGVGPWAGFLLVTGLLIATQAVDWLIARLVPGVGDNEASRRLWEWGGEAVTLGAVATASYGWLAVAFVALRRAHRLGCLWRSVRRGAIAAALFVGSLLGGFWAATEVWRKHFFDPTIVGSVIIALVGLTVMSGCGNTLTVGQVRRRELFSAMLTAWVLGMAIIWRWWGRPRSRPPGRAESWPSPPSS